MTSSDAERRIKDEITKVLDAHNIAYEQTRRSRHDAIMFTANGRRMIIPYANSGDPRAPYNARKQIRHLLASAGIVPPPQPELELEPESEQAGEETIVELVVEEQPPDDDQPQVDLPVEPPQAQLTEASYGLYAPRLDPNKCIVIELSRDLMASKGTMLVLPLDQPNTVIDISRELFDVMFKPTPVTQVPEPAPQPIPPPPIPPMPAEVPDEEEEDEPEDWSQPTIIRVPENADGKTMDRLKRQFAPETEQPEVQRFPEGASSFKKQRGRPPAPARGKKPPRANNVRYTPYREEHPRTMDGVSPQAARILATMVRVTDRDRRTELTNRHFEADLLEHDRKQIATRMPKLLELDLVERGLGIPDARGWHNKVTQKGRALVKRMGAWPWLYDGQEVPKWAQR